MLKFCVWMLWCGEFLFPSEQHNEIMRVQEELESRGCQLPPIKLKDSLWQQLHHSWYRVHGEAGHVSPVLHPQLHEHNPSMAEYLSGFATTCNTHKSCLLIAFCVHEATWTTCRYIGCFCSTVHGGAWYASGVEWPLLKGLIENRLTA